MGAHRDGDPHSKAQAALTVRNLTSFLGLSYQKVQPPLRIGITAWECCGSMQGGRKPHPMNSGTASHTVTFVQPVAAWSSKYRAPFIKLLGSRDLYRQNHIYTSEAPLLSGFRTRGCWLKDLTRTLRPSVTLWNFHQSPPPHGVPAEHRLNVTILPG